MARHSYRGKNGRFERCTVEKLFGIKTNESAKKYRCLNCGEVFMPILSEGFHCPNCQSKEAFLVVRMQRSGNNGELEGGDGSG